MKTNYYDGEFKEMFQQIFMMLKLLKVRFQNHNENNNIVNSWNTNDI